MLAPTAEMPGRRLVRSVDRGPDRAGETEVALAPSPPHRCVRDRTWPPRRAGRSSAMTGSLRFTNSHDFGLVVSGTSHKKVEVAWFQIAVEAWLAQPDSNRVRPTGERGLAVSPRGVAADSHITDQAVVMVPESASRLDKTRVWVERKGGLLIPENLDPFHVPRTLGAGAQICSHLSCPPAASDPRGDGQLSTSSEYRGQRPYPPASRCPRWTTRSLTRRANHDGRRQCFPLW